VTRSRARAIASVPPVVVPGEVLEVVEVRDNSFLDVLPSSSVDDSSFAVFRDLFASAPKSVGTFARLDGLIDMLTSCTGDFAVCELTSILSDAFPVTRSSRRHGPRVSRVVQPVSKRKLRRFEYADTQRLYRKNRGLCYKRIFSREVSPPLSLADGLPFWSHLFETRLSDLPSCTFPVFYTFPDGFNLWAPALDDEIRSCLPRRSTAVGPDDVSVRLLAGLPWEVLLKLVNLFLYLRRLPDSACIARTIFIPKSGPFSPGNFRPITIAPVILRLFHKILLSRLHKVVRHDYRQKGFQREDGVLQNIFTLDLVLKDASMHLRPLVVSSIDIAKAFDSVDHNALFHALSDVGFPETFVSYVRWLYSVSYTTLSFSDGSSDPILPRRGVRQGDPLSSMLFNVVMDCVIKSLPSHIGYEFADKGVLSVAAYADDVVLFSSTKLGMQKLVDSFVHTLNIFGLSINLSKSFVFGLQPSGRDKKFKVVSPEIKCYNGSLHKLTIGDTFSYLGTTFGTQGLIAPDILTPLTSKLVTLTAAPLKPQQRLFYLRCFLIPSFFHKLTLSHIHLGVLRKIDIVVRKFVRKWLCLPHDVPVSYFHADVPDGGLGIPALRWKIPLVRLARIRRTLQLFSLLGLNLPKHLLSAERSVLFRLFNDSSRLDTLSKQSSFWKNCLYRSIDGFALSSSAKVPGQHSWVSDGTGFLSGRDFLRSTQARINALPFRSRLARGRIRDRSCRAGCAAVETANHVSQVCYRTHGLRVKRHNSIVDFVHRRLTQNFGGRVIEEPILKVNDDVYKPDLLLLHENQAFVLDAQVVGDSVNLRDADRAKSEKYDKAPIRAYIKNFYSVRDVVFRSITLNWRGVWSPQSAEGLLRRRLIRKSDLKIISSRVLTGTLALCARHSTMIGGGPPRMGVG
jgi:hypothetical protein